MPLVTSRRTLVDVLLSPGGVLLWLTIPNVKLQPSRYFGSFFVSMAWLSITAYVVCLGSDRINLFWGIPRSFLGLTLVAVGTSWPNLLASVATARRGQSEGSKGLMTRATIKRMKVSKGQSQPEIVADIRLLNS